MMSFDRALSIIENKYPDRHFSGKAYKYDGSYYIEMATNNGKGSPIDSMFKIDGIKATITNYNPIVDGIIKPWEMEPIE